MTGPLVFLQAFLSCLVRRWKAGEIGEREFRAWELRLNMGVDLDVQRLAVLMPKMVKGLRNFAISAGLEMWDRETVEQFKYFQAQVMMRYQAQIVQIAGKKV